MLHSHTHSHEDHDGHSHAHTHSSQSHPEPPVAPVPPSPPPPSLLSRPSLKSPNEPPRLTIPVARQNVDTLLHVSPPFLAANLSTPFMPGPARDAYFALMGLLLTLQRAAHPPPTASSAISLASGTAAATARLRLKFWRQTVQDIFSGKQPPAEPVAVMLAESARTHAYTRGFFLRMVDTRLARVGDPPFANVGAMAEFGEGAYSTMLYLLGESMPGGRAIALEHVCSHIGRAMGVTEMLADFSTAVERRRRVLLPVDVLARYGLREEEVLNRVDLGDKAMRKRMQDAVFEVATHANDQLITARTMLEEVVTQQGGRRKIDDAMFAPVLTSVPVQAWLNKLEAVDFDVFDRKLKVKDWKMPWTMYWVHRRRSI
ncbi:Squalene/phytoene synthase-domain-containing protein [Limtongia smithiae]|uniref:Squalene/phytoene synthase-domain-containing protein n=1 Tax=Limtongia smithiae TaxID=1125753 RepID=UPI0034CF86A9